MNELPREALRHVLTNLVGLSSCLLAIGTVYVEQHGMEMSGQRDGGLALFIPVAVFALVASLVFLTLVLVNYVRRSLVILNTFALVLWILFVGNIVLHFCNVWHIQT